jgi:hypothetical protein
MEGEEEGMRGGSWHEHEHEAAWVLRGGPVPYARWEGPDLGGAHARTRPGRKAGPARGFSPPYIPGSVPARAQASC